MQPLNLLRKAIAGCAQTEQKYRATAPEYVLKAREILDVAKQSVKFILPDNGQIFGDKLRGLPEDFRLPFPSVVIEYICTSEGGVAERHFGRDAVFEARERVVIAQQDGDSILVTSAIGMRLGD